MSATAILSASLQAALVPGDGMAPPVAVLWTDEDGQWADLVARLRGELPSLFTLGDYNPELRTGPAIWLRCIVDRSLPDLWPKDAKPPILYLPRVERQQLRAGGDCPIELQPLVELQYRGAVWHQRNGRDWSVEAFLTSADGCRLELAKDQQTRSALARVLSRLAPTGKSSFELTYTSIHNEHGCIRAAGTSNHVGHEVLVARGVKDSHLMAHSSLDFECFRC